MDAYCPRCANAIPQIDKALLESGKCPTCGGQLNVGGVTSDLPVEGAVAMSFAAGSRVAVPLDAIFSETQLDLDAAIPGLDQVALEATMGGPQSSHEQETVVAPPPNDNDTVEDHAANADEAQPESTGDSPADLAAETSDSADQDAPEAGSEEERPAEERPAEERPAEERPAEDEPAEDIPAEEEPVAADSPPTGAHLKLPSIDFSMPDLGTLPAPPSNSTAPPRPSGELPAHLQLPNFPDFELPPIPGEEKQPIPPKEKQTITGDIAIEATVGGSFAAEANASGTSTLPTAGAGGAGPGAESWSVADATQPSVPPPLPAPPPLPSQQQQPAQAARRLQEDLPSLPGGFGLPALGSRDAGGTHEPTLVQSEVAARVAQAERRSRLPFVIVGALLLLLAGIGGTVVYFGPSTVASWFGGKPDADVVETKRDRAEEHNFAGEVAYREGEAAEKAKKKKEAQAKYKAAIASFRKALVADHTFAKAHRNLAIALAKSNKQAEAVEQYRAYLRKNPDAPDKKEVRKIINDWEASQDKKRRR